ncbi:hypothetical protein ACFO3G_03255, partial [Falsiporphyromonas endometrii]
MRPLIKKILKKLHLDRYLSAKLVLAMDLMVATAASILTMVMLGLLMKKEMTISKFVIEWVLLSMAAALISFLIFKTYKAIIRHSTLREVGKFVLAAALKEVVMVAYMLYNFHVQLSTEIIVGTAFVDFLLTLSMLVVEDPIGKVSSIASISKNFGKAGKLTGQFFNDFRSSFTVMNIG